MLGINIFNKEYPDFWKKYTDSFKNKATKYTVISMETSGLEVGKDIIMSVACSSIVGNKIILKDSFEMYIQHAKLKELNLNNEFLSLSKFEKIIESKATEHLINCITNSILIGHRINFDIEMIDNLLSKQKLGKIRNEAFDIEAMFNKYNDTSGRDYSLEEMCSKLAIKMSERNSIADDTYAISLLFLKLKEKLRIK